jgi:hypothetical protein
MPVVAFDLKETRVSANGAGCYITSGDVAAYARALVALLDDAEKREDMGREGRLRIEKELGWPHQRDAYVGVYERLVGRTPQAVGPRTPPRLRLTCAALPERLPTRRSPVGGRPIALATAGRRDD